MLDLDLFAGGTCMNSCSWRTWFRANLPRHKLRQIYFSRFEQLSLSPSALWRKIIIKKTRDGDTAEITETMCRQLCARWMSQLKERTCLGTPETGAKRSVSRVQCLCRGLHNLFASSRSKWTMLDGDLKTLWLTIRPLWFQASAKLFTPSTLFLGYSFHERSCIFLEFIHIHHTLGRKKTTKSRQE